MRRSSSKHSWRLRAQTTLAAVASAVLLGAGIASVAPASDADALSGSEFIPGMIIADSLFYDGGAMTEAQIQAFLVSKGSGLAGYTFSVGSRDAKYAPSGVLRCSAFTGGQLSSSTIIYRAQVACGISAKVLLVTLQKEQGLITKSAPSQAAMDRAMGYACPDTAPCAPTTLGFGNQVYSAALQFITYKVNQFGRQPGWNSIAYTPNSVPGCEPSTIYIQNYATAALYNYTPYQPDSAALANLYGSGGSCSSYGNRNFWVYYNTWFGSTLGLTPYPVMGPSIAGTTQVGTTVSATGTWSGSPTMTYVWVTCTSIPSVIVDTVPTQCLPIPAATGSSYASTGADVGKYLGVMVTATNSYGSMTTGTVMASRIGTPVNLVAPTQSGAPEVGSTLTVDVGTWVGVPPPTMAIYWLRCTTPITSAYSVVPAACAVIPGASASTYLISSADTGYYLTAQVAGNSSVGFSIVGTLSTVITGFPLNTVPPSVSGVASVGSTWTVDAGTWVGTPTPSIAIYWLRCAAPVNVSFTVVPANCTVISGARTKTYVSTLADDGMYLTAQVAGNSVHGFTLAGALNSLVMSARPVNTAAPTVSGSAAVGSTWTVNPGSWTGNPTIAINWLRCDHAITSAYTIVPSGCTVIPGASSSSYVATSADAGQYLTAQVAGNGAQGFTLVGALNSQAIAGQSTSPPSLQLPGNTVAPKVAGSAAVGSTWTVDTGTWTGNPAPTIAINWLRCASSITSAYSVVPAGCSVISGATGTSYVSAAADAGKYLTAQVAGNSPLGFTIVGALNSLATAGTSLQLPGNTVAPKVAGSAAVGSTWTVDTGTWTGNPAPTIAINWLRCASSITSAYSVVPAGCSVISGATGTSYVSAAADAGKYLTAQVAGNSPLGFTIVGALNSLAISGVPANLSAPRQSGASAVGLTLTVDVGTWTGAPTPTTAIHWLRCTQPVTTSYSLVPPGCLVITGATATHYLVAAADSGSYLTAQVAGNNSAGFSIVGTISTVPVGYPQNTVPPTASGAAPVGSTWTVAVGTWVGNPAPSIAVNWLRCSAPITSVYTLVPSDCTVVSGATAVSYVSTTADNGMYLTAQVAGNSPLGFTIVGTLNTIATASLS